MSGDISNCIIIKKEGKKTRWAFCVLQRKFSISFVRVLVSQQISSTQTLNY